MSELEHTDALAAEYVLGTLDAGERAQARALLTVDPGFVAKVQFWERRLGELHTMVEPVEPEPGLWLRIKARITEPQAAPVGLPEPQNLEPAPAAVAADVAPGEAPSLEEIEATIAEATAALNAEAASAPPAEALAAEAATAEGPTGEAPRAEAPAGEVPAPETPATEVPSLDAIEVTISETTVTLSADAAQAPSSDAAAAALDGTSAAAPAETAPAPPAEAAPVPGWEAAPAPPAEVAPAPGWEAAPAPPAEAVPAPAWEAAPAAPAEPMPAAPVLTVAEVADATAAAETTAPAEAPAAETPPEPTSVEPVVPPSELPPPLAAAPVLTTEEKWTPAVEPQQAVMAVRRGLRRWRAFALLMTLVVLAVAALLAAWRFAPERVPPVLRPLELMRQLGVTVPAAPPPRRPLPPQTQFDE
jgi:hypothetical protein